MSYQQGHGDALADKEILRDKNIELRAENKRLRLTDAEREAIAVAAEAYANDHGERFAAILRGLLERTSSKGTG